MRRLDCVLAPTKAAVLTELATRIKAGVNPEPFLLEKAGGFFYNTSPLDLKTVVGDQDHIGENLRAYLQAFSPEVRDIFERFDFHIQIDRLAKAGLLYQVTEKFVTIDGEILTKPGIVRHIYDPTAGTGGMLTVAAEHLEAHNPKARPVMYGQELNPESYAI